MSHQPLSPPFLLLIAAVTSAVLVAADPATFPYCNQTFNCGDIQNITYPFTGGDRPDYCGPPEFRLRCLNDIVEFDVSPLTYRVLRVDQVLSKLTIARSDLWNSTCTDQFVNTTFNSTLFHHDVPGNLDLTMFYGCYSPLTIKPMNEFSCNVSGGNSSNAYYILGAVPSDPIFSVIQCNASVEVPILQTAVAEIGENRSTLGEAFMEGFYLNYSTPYDDECAKCLDSGGECGFVEVLGSVCFCNDKLCSVAEKKSSSIVPIAVGVSAASAAILVLCLIFIYMRKRKQQAIKEQSLASESKSKGLPTPNPSSYFSQSIPSYPSSNIRTDLEKGSTYFGVQVFTDTELEEATNNFDATKILGDGGFGTVYYGTLRDGRIVAVKRLFENNFKRVEQFMNEVEILTRLRHKNLVTLFGCTSRRSRELLLVYEYIPNGTVADHVHGKHSNSGLLTWPVRLSIAIETADALAYLHRSDVIHRDVKTNNILLDNEFRVKVADFGLSRLFPTDVTHISTAPQGTPGYVDPEYYQCYQLTEKSDVYSYGVVLMELVSSKLAVDTSRHRHDINLANMAVNKIQNQTLDELVDSSIGFHTDEAVKRKVTMVCQLAFRCLQPERDMRPTMEEVLEALREIEKKDFSAENQEVVDIGEDYVGLLKNELPPVLPDEKWVSNTTTPNSSSG